MNVRFIFCYIAAVVSLHAISGKELVAGKKFIDQQTYRRITKEGLTAFDKHKAMPGYALYSPISGPGMVYLVDIKGKVVHQWNLPFPPGLYGYLLPNGNLFYMGKVRDETWDLWPDWYGIKGGILMEVDWNGNIVWEYRDPYQHHDARRTSTGGAMYLAIERVPGDISELVKGGVADTDNNDMWADVIIEVDKEGNRIWEWHSYEHLDPETDMIQPNCTRTEWGHANALEPIDEERVLVSFRNISVVGIVNKTSGDFEWKLGSDLLSQQHDASMLPNGNVLIFDNGEFRKDEHIPYSRVIEVKPLTKEVVWDYEDSPEWNFFSPSVSGVQRLPNGNTFITEGFYGRMFQVTPDGRVVWEYISPHFFRNLHGSIENIIFKAIYYTEEQIFYLSQIKN
ncbi:MAG: aryl sulfotransferase [Candidatus Kuenenia sp.]|nr:aryl sulfotransferase [Candidatus Kuenenia hertensis]